MDWKAFGESLAKIGLPLLGAVLPLPGGAAIGTALASMIGSKPDPESILQALSSNADALQKAKQFEYQHQETMLKMSLDAQTAQVDAVNKTLQTEAMGGSWLQKNHHAIESMFVCGLVAAIYVVLPVLHIPVPAVDPTVWLMLGGILGVTAWQRGAANIATAKN
jgi:hypothetical protein